MFHSLPKPLPISRPSLSQALFQLVSRVLVLMLVIFTGGSVSARADETPFAVERLKSGNYILMMRHARAPGTGDPSGFKLEDCSTQRNLDESGREQARRLGRRLKAAGLERVAIYSSQWCRCMETARALALGPVRELPALNSFYQRERDRAGNLAALGAFIERLGTATDRPVILVTHQVTISAMSGASTASGEAKVFRLDGTGRPEMVGTIPAE